ncbi:MAG: 50S ribosomal protein L18 [Bacteroidota bacterium]|nr:50S ribosomal protein L18 [Bacteroidota bacterium]
MLRKEYRRNKIRARIRSRVAGTAQKPRLSVFRSNKYIYAQLIDDLAGKTLVYASSRAISEKAPNVELSALVGKTLAEKAVSAGIVEVVFDRGGYLYHGRVKALADGAREGGLKF